MAVLLMCTKILRGPFWCGRQAHDQQDMFLLRCDGVAVGTGRADVLQYSVDVDGKERAGNVLTVDRREREYETESLA